MDRSQDRRSEPRTELHRIWTVSLEGDQLGHRLAQLHDYSASGMRLALDAVCGLRSGERLLLHYPGTKISYPLIFAWTKQGGSRQQHHTIVGARLLAAPVI